MPPRRLTRQESQARTRERLLDAASKQFARRGLEQTTIAQVAEAAGYTKGAFYANFKNKDELCLAMLDRRFEDYLERFDGLLATDQSPEQRARVAGEDLGRLVEADPEWQRLSFEFAVYAMRNGRFRRELVARHEALRERIAEIFRARAKEMGIDAPMSIDEIVLMTFAMANGVALGQLLEPERYSGGLHGGMLAVFFRGLRALAEEGAVSKSSGRGAERG